MIGAGDLVFVGDVHLDRDDEHLDSFLAFLDSLRSGVSRIVFMGDLFNLWVGRRELEQPHQRAVIERLAALRAGGIVVRYLEGNRDFRLAPAYTGWALDAAAEDGVEENLGGRRIYAIHGDLANPRDRLYRAWRHVARSRTAWWGVGLVPRTRRLRFVEALEDRLRRANRDFKRAFPEQEVRDYAASFLARGYDTVVLGHFHVEKDLEAAPPSPRGRIFVLPEWKERRRYLRVTPDGRIEFETAAAR